MNTTLTRIVRAAIQNRLAGMLVFILALTAVSSAQTPGFNVNSEVTFTPLTQSYRTSSSTAGCPSGFVGKFTFTAVLANKLTGPAMPGVNVRVLTLTNGNVLLDPQTNAVLGGAGAEVRLPKVGQYADGLLSAGESVDMPFILCLKTFQPFQFFVDVFGVVTRLVSINPTGTSGGDRDSFVSALSANGRYVAFGSRAGNLVANDANGTGDAFVRDTQSGITTLLSINRMGTGSGNNGSGIASLPVISADGRFVAFSSDASDLVANDTNGKEDVFVRDLAIGTTTMASVNRSGTSGGNQGSNIAAISGNGRFVAFSSFASDLVANDTNGNGDVFVRDLLMQTTQLVSINRAGTNSGSGFSLSQVLSADGRFVAFESGADDLVLNDTNGKYDVFVRDLQSGTTTLVSINRTGGNGGAANSFGPVITPDGRYVAFVSEASDLVAADSNGSADVFLRNLQTGVTTLISFNRNGNNGGNASSSNIALSADGRFAAFSSNARDLVAIDTQGHTNVFVRDIQLGITKLVSVNSMGTGGGNFGSRNPVISADGRVVAFFSDASNLSGTPDSATTAGDVFVRDLQTETTSAASINRSGTNTGNSGSEDRPVISADGRFVAFTSYARDLVAIGTNFIGNVYIRPVP